MATIINFENRTDNDVLFVVTENGAVFTEDDFIEEFIEGALVQISSLIDIYGEEKFTELIDKIKEKYGDDPNRLIEKGNSIFEKMIKEYEV